MMIRHKIIFFFLILTLGVSMACRKIEPSMNSVCFKEACFNIEIARTPEELARGLQHRYALDSGQGMLFIFDSSAIHSFWMKDTFIPLDMIWMDYARRIVHIAHNVKPCAVDPCPSYAPAEKAMYVLEINANQAKALSLKVGDTADFYIHP